MQLLKQKLAALLQLLTSKAASLRALFSSHFLLCLAIAFIPVLLIFAIRYFQQPALQKALAQPELTGRRVRAVEKAAAGAQQQALHYKAKADSLAATITRQDKPLIFAQHKADSLHIRYEKTPTSWNPATLQSYLSTYKPGADSL